MFYRKYILILATAACCLLVSPATSALDTNWLDLQVVTVTDESEVNSYEECYTGSIDVVDQQSSVSNREACIYSANSYNIARYVGGDGNYYWAVKPDTSSKYVQLLGLSLNSRFDISPSSDRITYLEYSASTYNHTSLISVDDLLESLEVASTGVGSEITAYRIRNQDTYKYFTYTIDGTDVETSRSVWSIAYSLNGRYALAWVDTTAHVKIDLDTREVKVLTYTSSLPPVNVYAPKALAISNNGNVAFIGAIPRAINTTDCGYVYSDNLLATDYAQFLKLGNECLSYQYELFELAGFEGYGSNARWLNDRSLELTYKAFPFSRPDWADLRPKKVTFSGNVSEETKIDYIALGDSYSSGEGDVSRLDDGSSFYIKGTQAPGECHISSRSYPFLIAKLNQVGEEQMKSIACSGAQMGRDYYGQSSDYYGQHDSLKGLSETDISTKRVEALKSFTPGMVKQIKFVEEHKPKVVTLTGGGNDVGFARLLAYCAMPSGAGAATNTCDQAVPNTLLRSMLGDAIQSQYKTTIELIAALKAASDKTTVYVIGYPSFVSDGRTSCANAGFLNQREREVINQSVAYMNTVLKTAASAGGAKFIDIETSLVGGRLCEGSEFVTGPVDVAGFDIIDRKQEMFHPNSAGHQQMAQVIAAKGFKVQGSDNPAPVSAVVPTKPKVFGSGKYVPTFQEKMTTDLAVAAHSYVWMSIAPGYFAANKPVKLTIYSQPDTLGTLVAGSKGSVSGKLSLSGRVSPGYHMLVAEGTSPIGESTRLYQFVEVTSGRVNDRDGDGILDDQDRCQYVNFWIDEDGGNDICTTHHKPGLGLGNGYGHIISNGSHAGHKNIDVSQSMFSLD